MTLSLAELEAGIDTLPVGEPDRGPRCTVGVALARLREQYGPEGYPVIDRLEQKIDDPAFKAGQLRGLLARAGAEVSAHTIRRHKARKLPGRSERCSCPT